MIIIQQFVEVLEEKRATTSLVLVGKHVLVKLKILIDKILEQFRRQLFTVFENIAVYLVKARLHA